MEGGETHGSVALWRSAISGDGELGLRILADTNIFIKFTHRQPLAPAVEEALDDSRTERFISPVTVLEVFRLWKCGRLQDNPDTWVGNALMSWTVLPVTVAIARQSVLWNWEHRDPADRLLAATAQVDKVELWHTDTVLKKLRGFPGRYFQNVEAKGENSENERQAKR